MSHELPRRSPVRFRSRPTMRAMETNALLLTAALAADSGWSWERTVRPAHPEPLAFGAAVAAAGGASEGWSGDHFEDMGTWFRALMADSFA